MAVGHVEPCPGDFADERRLRSVDPAPEVFEPADPHDRVAGVVGADSDGEQFVQRLLGVLQRACPCGIADLRIPHPGTIHTPRCARDGGFEGCDLVTTQP